MADLEQQLDQERAESWRPEPGDKIVGTLVSVSNREGGQYADYPILVVRRDDGSEAAIHAFREVLQSELARNAPAIGDRIGVKYEGQREGEGYHRYRVVVERPAGTAVDWGRYSDEAPRQPAPAVTAPSTTGPMAATPMPGRDEDIPF